MVDELRSAVKSVLQESQAPKSISQIRKELAGAFRLSSKDLGALLDKMTAAGEIFSWPQKKFWDRDPASAMPGLILALMTRSPVASASKIRTNLKLPLDMVEAALNELIDSGKL